jgi:hypothetical protein
VRQRGGERESKREREGERREREGKARRRKILDKHKPKTRATPKMRPGNKT